MAKETITVCSNCLTHSCWMGLFLCDEAVTAGTVEKTREELGALDREHPDYWEDKTYYPQGQVVVHLTSHLPDCIK